MADEAAMTGESEEVKKEPLAKCLSYQREKEMDTTKTTTVKITRAHDLPSPIMMSGSSISGVKPFFSKFRRFLDASREKVDASIKKVDASRKSIFENKPD
jgi:hypothetical protein